ncbi:MAG: TlpA family protein disulfide reductase [Solirubrobacteraceae bacterium]|nr:TlpA family protein disulfide reductase [Solirubrobacteraceae bacterium]
MPRRRPTRRTVLATATAAVLVALTIGVLQSDPTPGVADDAPDATELRRSLADAPPVLRDLYARGDRILELDRAGFTDLLGTLRGRPVVINKWGSWCGPCRDEFPVLRRALATHGTTVAFLGLNVEDTPSGRAAFLRGAPAGYPHVEDTDQTLATDLDARGGSPMTIFLDARGRVVHVKAGPYADLADLEDDLHRYVGVAPTTSDTTTGTATPSTATPPTPTPAPDGATTTGRTGR